MQFTELPWSDVRAARLDVVLPDGATVRGALSAEVAELVRLLRD